MKLNYDFIVKQYEKHYRVEKEQVGPDDYIIKITPRKRNCKYCGKSFDSVGTEFITWKDKNNYTRSGYFCKRHMTTIKKVLKEVNSRI